MANTEKAVGLVSTERERFEQWASSRNCNLSRYGNAGDGPWRGLYMDAGVELIWAAWQAASESKAKDTTMNHLTGAMADNYCPVEIHGETLMERHLKEELRIANAHLLDARQRLQVSAEPPGEQAGSWEEGYQVGLASARRVSVGTLNSEQNSHDAEIYRIADALAFPDPPGTTIEDIVKAIKALRDSGWLKRAARRIADQVNNTAGTRIRNLQKVLTENEVLAILREEMGGKS